eukprot:gene17682-24611_t
MAKSSSAKDLQLINHAIALTEYHGGSIHLKNALHFVKNLFGNKKKKKETKLETPMDYGKRNGHFDKPPKPEPKPEPKPQPKPQEAPPPPQKHPHEHHYATLGLTSNATPAEVTKAYRKLAMQYHPDRNKEADPQIMKQINNAYETITGKGIRKRKNLKK